MYILNNTGISILLSALAVDKEFENWKEEK